MWAKSVCRRDLPLEERALQRRYTQLERFNVFLPPTGKYRLPGPEDARLPNTAEGLYLLLLRVEAADDKEGDSNLAAVGAGAGIVHSGAVAGFPLPVLRYFVGGSQSAGAVAAPLKRLALLQPGDEALLSSGQPLDFSWAEDGQAAFYQLEVGDAQGQPLLAAVLPPGAGVYRAPSWLQARAGAGSLRWRVLALDRTGKQMGETGWRRLKLAAIK